MATAHPRVRVVGLGPGDPDLLTLGSLEALRAASAVVPLLAPPALALFLESEGIRLARDLVDDPGLFVRGSAAAIGAFVARLDGEDLALAVPGDPLSDFPGLPLLSRELDGRRIRCELVPGMPRATLAGTLAIPLVPLPPASTRLDWSDLVEVMARLRRSCPWDREQTHASLVPFLIEETYEVVDAIERGADGELCGELGDVLLQVVFHAQLATERGAFSVADVVNGLANKLIRRHPHVFGDRTARHVADVERDWEMLKAEEPETQARTSLLDGVPSGLGALQSGQKLQSKAARVGFDWPHVDGVRAKLAEELSELEEARRANDPRAVREELGDAIFTLVNLARTLGVDAEGAMRDANAKFRRRFTWMEREATRRAETLQAYPPDELEALWTAAKADVG